MKRLISLFKFSYAEVRKYATLYLIAFGIGQILWLLLPYLSARVIWVLENSWTVQQLYFFVIVTLVISLIALIFDKTTRWLYVYLEQELDNKLAIKYRWAIARLQIRHIHDVWTWKLLSKFEQGIRWQVQVFMAITRLMIVVWVRWTALFLIIAIKAPSILAVLWLLIVIFALVELFLKKKVEKVADDIRDLNEEISKANVRFLTEHNLVRVANAIETEQAWLKKTLPILTKKILRQYVYADAKDFILHYGIHLIEATIWVYFGVKILRGEWTIADFILITWYIRWFWWPIQEAISGFNIIQKNMNKYEALNAYLKWDTFVDGTDEYVYKNGDIKIDNLVFGYKQDSALFDWLCMHIQWWKMTAFVWHSGSWKSTLVKMLLRLYDYTWWSISVDDQVISDIKVQSWYDTIGYLSQDPSVFDWTIQQNLLYWLSEERKQIALQDEWKLLWDALESAQIADFIREKEGWLQTEIGERWVKLSWWERQRVAIARLFLKDPKILILDEPTSALDSVSESAISTVMKTLFVNRTVIVIAHRLQTVMHADDIVVFEKGKIIQQWNHNKLISETEWVYKKLIDLQSWALL